MTVTKGEMIGENYITRKLVNMNIKDISVDYDYFSRVTLDEDTIARYREQYELGESLPPLVVQKEKNILIDGFHRLEAQKRLRWEETEVELMDIPENKIYITSIELNRRHGLPFSKEDRNEQIRRLRFERTPPLTYEEIGKSVGLSTSRVGEICRKMEFKINGTIIPKVDVRKSITREQTDEIKERLDAGESTSDIAKDYPVSESRVSQLKKDSQQTKAYKITKQKTLAQQPRSWILRSLKKRFKANNPLADSQEIDFDAYLDVEAHEFYSDLLEEYEKAYPQYNWRYPDEDSFFGTSHGIPLELVYDKSVDIRLKLYWSGEGKYAHVKGTVPKKALEYVRDRLYNEFTIEWPLAEVERPVKRPVFSGEDLSEMEERSQMLFREPEFEESEEDEEMRKWGDLIPEE